MMIINSDKNRISKVCNHEAGHLLISKIFLFKTDGLCLEVNQNAGHSGEATTILPTKGINSTTDLIDYLNKRIQILYAGVIAESMHINGDYDGNYALNEWRKRGGVVDYAKIRELTHVLRNITFTETSEDSLQQKELDLLDKENFQTSVKLVSENIVTIHKIGKLLFDKIKMYDTKYCVTEIELGELEEIKNLK